MIKNINGIKQEFNLKAEKPINSQQNAAIKQESDEFLSSKAKTNQKQNNKTSFSKLVNSVVEIFKNSKTAEQIPNNQSSTNDNEIVSLTKITPNNHFLTNDNVIVSLTKITPNNQTSIEDTTISKEEPIETQELTTLVKIQETKPINCIESLISACENEEDDTSYNKLISILKSGGTINQGNQLSDISDLDDDEYKKIINFLKADPNYNGNKIDIKYAIKYTKLPEEQYSKLFEFRKLGGAIDDFNPESLYSLNDEELKRAYSLIPFLKSQSYILSPIKKDGTTINFATDERLFNNAMKMFKTSLPDNITPYYRRYEIVKDYAKDDVACDRFASLISQELDVSSKIFPKAKVLSDLKVSEFEKVKQMLSDGVSKDYNALILLVKLDDEQYEKALNLIDLGCEAKKAVFLSKNGVYEKTVELLNVGTNPTSLNDMIIEGLTKEQLEKIKTAISVGTKDFQIARKIKDLDETAYSKALELASFKVPKYDYSKAALLDDEQYQQEIEKLKAISSQLEFDEVSEEIELPEITEDEREQILSKIRSCGNNVSSTESNKTLANLWLKKYIEGVNIADGQLASKMLQYSCDRYKIPEGEYGPLARWLLIIEPEEFFENFPEAGEIYKYDNIQSFAKTISGAEQIFGNNFSDSNPNRNVKFVVYPKNLETKAFDTGEGKYGADEAIYRANQEFRVLHKAIEDVEGRNLYTIYMQEM